MDKEEILARTKEVVQKFDEEMKKLNDALKVEFSNSAKWIFDKYPQITDMAMPAYTPYWCDGDVCTYRTLNDMECILINGVRVYNIDEEKSNPDKLTEAMFEDACDFFNSFPESFYQRAFEEGKITVHRDGTVTVEEYRHE